MWGSPLSLGQFCMKLQKNHQNSVEYKDGVLEKGEKQKTFIIDKLVKITNIMSSHPHDWQNN